MENLREVKIFARIRTLGIAAQYSSNEPTKEISDNKSSISTKQSIKNVSKQIINASSLAKDFKCCVFTSSSKEKS